MKEKSSLTKRYFSVFFLVVGIVLLLICLFEIWMLVWGLVSSFKSRIDFISNPAGFPKKWIWGYTSVFKKFVVPIGSKKIYLGELLFNSLFLSVSFATVQTIVPTFMAYVAAKYPFKFNKVINGIVWVVVTVPIIGSTGSSIQLSKFLGVYDNYFGQMLMKFSFQNSTYLVMLATLTSLSTEYAEAAFMDGAGHFDVMIRIMLPMVLPTISCLWLLSFIAHWNEYQSIMIYYPSRPTAAYGLFLFRTDTKNSIPMTLQACFIMIMPTLAIFIAFRNKIMGHFTIGGLKG